MLSLLFYFLSSFHHANAIPPNCDCQYPIYYFELSQAFPAPCHLPDTILLNDVPGFKNTLIITDCQGSAVYTSFDMGRNKLVHTSTYTKATELSVDSIYTYNEETFKESLEVVSQYRPLRTNVVEY